MEHSKYVHSKNNKKLHKKLFCFSSNNYHSSTIQHIIRFHKTAIESRNTTDSQKINNSNICKATRQHHDFENPYNLLVLLVLKSYIIVKLF